MRYWISHIRSLESFADHREVLLDAWEEGGVDGLVIGPMVLNMPETLAHSRQTTLLPHRGDTSASFVPDPEIYRALDAEAPIVPPASEEPVRARVRAALQAVVDRGWELWIFDPLIGAVAPDGNHVWDLMLDEQVRRNLAARMLDTVAAYPMVTGVIIDGPAWGFEIMEIPAGRMPRRRLIFDELPDSGRAAVARLGYDFDALARAKDRLWENLHRLEARQVAAHAADSPDEALAWLGGPAAVDWVNFRVDSLTSLYEDLTGVLRERAGADVQFAVCPRQPAIARMAGYDYGRVSSVVDVVMPKLYYWQRGYDGLPGTAHRWARALTSWNPGLSVRDASQVARLVFGEAMPVVDQMIDFDRIMSAEYVGWLAGREAAQSVAAIGDRARIVPWVDTGRAPHDGDPLTARHLEAIITAVTGAGIDHLNFFNATNLTEGDWTMLSHHGGREWNPDRSTYLPPDRPTL